jgi:hypothetical protein
VIYFNKQEALRYFGAGREDTRAGAAVDLAFLKLRNELQPKYTARRFACQVTDTGVQVRTGTAAGTGIFFTSRNLARHLAGCRELFLFAATLGIKVDSALRRLTLNSAAEGAAAQAVAAALIETYCDSCCGELENNLEPGLKLLSRFSPGYGDWDLAEQPKIFSLLDGIPKIGLTLTDGCMMAPVKSVTAVLGICAGTKPTYGTAPAGTGNNCAGCKNFQCEFRR